MSQYDSCEDTRPHWACPALFAMPAESPSAPHLMRELKPWSGKAWLCAECLSCLDPWDLAHGDFGDIHCTYCAGTDIDFDADLSIDY